MTQGVKIVVGDVSVMPQTSISGSYGNDSLASGIYKEIEGYPEDFENVAGIAAYPVGASKAACIILRDDDRSVRNIKYKTTGTLMEHATIGAGAWSSRTGGVSLLDAIYGAVTVSGMYRASAISGVSVYAYSSPDGLNYDTDALFSFDASFTANSPVQKTYSFDPTPSYIQFALKNNDVVYPVTSGSLWITLTKEGLS